MEGIEGGMEDIDGGMEGIDGGMEGIEGGMEDIEGGMEDIDGGMEDIEGETDPDTLNPERTEVSWRTGEGEEQGEAAEETDTGLLTRDESEKLFSSDTVNRSRCTLPSKWFWSCCKLLQEIWQTSQWKRGFSLKSNFSHFCSGLKSDLNGFSERTGVLP